MDLASDKLKQLDNPTLTPDQRALIRCQAAAGFIHAGQYEAARDALGDMWQGVGRRPFTEALKKATTAEALLQCGVLSGWLGSARNMSGSQEAAKDLISEALRLFESLKQPVKVAEAQYELGICYWRIGAFDNARVVLVEASREVGDKDTDLKAKILIRRSLIETWACRYHDAWDVLREAESFFKNLSDAFKGRWHGQMGLVLRRLGMAEDRSDYLDRAIVEHTAAIYHYEQAGHERYCAVNLNNLAMLLYRLGRYPEAHDHLDRAVAIFTRLRDPGNLAQVNETRARVLLAEQRYVDAEQLIESVIEVFERGGEQSCLADALTIQATVLARLGQHERSLAIFRRAIGTASEGGSQEKAGQASLSLIEEHGSTRLSGVELYDAYRRADTFLKGTQDSEDIKRLRACALIMGRRLLGMRISDADFNLTAALHEYEARFIEEALERAQGSVTRAAQLLGFKHHGSLAGLIERRHPELLKKRSPVVRRQRSIIVKDQRREKQVRPLTILHVEDHQVVAEAVRDTLEMEGWRVVMCSDGAVAISRMASGAKYDLMIFDNHLPNVNGLELVRYARQLPGRRRTPIIMFSASDVESEARGAGVDAFLRKPNDVGRLFETIKQLLKA
ncbi:MAG: tetratricopeptide repeat protein [Acidobacteria bacterium]|nr:tetratricopeptide repeat protein [Acidobacteriota bacterium]